MKKKQVRPTSRFDKLTAAQKEAVFRDAERITVGDGRPLTAADRKLHRKAGLKVGRPRVGQGAKRVNISIEKTLLKDADAFARKQGMTRARLIAKRVEAYIAGAA